MSIIRSNKVSCPLTARILEERDYELNRSRRWFVYHFVRKNPEGWRTSNGSATFYYNHTLSNDDVELELYVWMRGDYHYVRSIEELVRVEEYFQNL